MNPQDIDPLSRLTLLVFRAQHALSTDGDQLSAPWGLTSAKWKVLGAVALSGGALSAAGIGRAMGMSRQAAIKQIRLLTEQGLLAGQADPRDARAPVYHLTPGGHDAFNAISEAWAVRSRTLSSSLPSGSIERASALLETLLDRLADAPANSPDPEKTTSPKETEQ